MAVNYKIAPINNSRFPEGNPSHRVSLVTKGNVGIEELAEQINIMSSCSPGDLCGIIRNLVTLIANELAAGQTVTLEDLGTFSLSAELKNPSKKPEEITGKDIDLKRVCFKAAPMLKQKIKENIVFHQLPSDMNRWR